MRRWVLGTTFVAVMGLLALPNIACEDPMGGDSQALHVVGNTFVSTRTQCQIRAGATEFRPRGYMDVAVTNTYFLYPQVENMLPESAELTALGTSELRLNNNNITIIGATINYDVDDFYFGADFDPYQGVFMRASGSVQPGEVAPTVVQAVPWELGNALANHDQLSLLGGAGTDITMRVRVVGRLADGTQIQSSEFWYPLTICNGCMIYFPPLVDPRRLEENITVPCVPGQDDGVDTRLCYLYATSPTVDVETLNQSRDRCRWAHILGSIEPPDSNKYWDIYGRTFFPQYIDYADPDGCGLNGQKCKGLEPTVEE